MYPKFPYRCPIFHSALGSDAASCRRRPGVRRWWAVVCLSAGLAACDSVETGTTGADYVVESILVSGEPLPPVRLSRTAAINSAYDFDRLAVTGAAVSIDLLGASGSAHSTTPYAELPDSAGVYVPSDTSAAALPLGTYRLSIRIPATGETISGITTVPDTFTVIAGTRRTAVYQSTEQLELTMTRSRSSARSETYFIVITEALDPDPQRLTPLAADILENEVGDADFESLVVSASPIFNEENYDVNPDGSLSVRYPWIGINFYGPNRIGINALDENAYDFFRSQSVQQGGSTLSPGEIPNPLENIEGAHGIFGSYAQAYYDLLVLPPPGDQ